MYVCILPSSVSTPSKTAAKFYKRQTQGLGGGIKVDTKKETLGHG